MKFFKRKKVKVDSNSDKVSQYELEYQLYSEIMRRKPNYNKFRNQIDSKSPLYESITKTFNMLEALDDKLIDGAISEQAKFLMRKHYVNEVVFLMDMIWR